ncbi:zinc metalloproteinase nas-15 [Orussus abietinus]|uniref:zinc metalloproteinase nas-15 n=1 Tax=Orussus abietinus TaxID=222816 RepID=UPI0006265021|nr:zinc metalloproteinase nas-15 [Orussus abietinus]
MVSREFLLLVLGVAASGASPARTRRGAQGVVVPPEPKYRGVFAENYDHEKVAERLRSWTPSEKGNLWELSGLDEGDIMFHPDSPFSKNGLLNETARWPEGVVPYYIQEKDFDEKDISVINGAIEDYHKLTCLRFRKYKETDQDYVIVQGSKSGCWSLVGRHGQGQVLNLQNPGCLRHGVVIHEFLHALGFYHQQSASDRDDWIQIHWENIKEGKEHNFNKYDNRTITDYGVGYDYNSVMHYSTHAFSKNGEPTISPTKKEDEAQLGQRDGLSKKDMAKLEMMYKQECRKRKSDSQSNSDSIENEVIDWIFN